MLVSIGRRAGAPGGVELLLECHDRIRRFLAMARRLAASTGATPAELADAAAQIHRYFTLALPLHVRDEETTVAGLLAGHAALARMTAEHHDHEPLIAQLVTLCDALTRGPERLAELAPVAEALERALLAHLTFEEATIFPALRALPPTDQAALLDGIRSARR